MTDITFLLLTIPIFWRQISADNNGGRCYRASLIIAVAYIARGASGSTRPRVQVFRGRISTQFCNHLKTRFQQKV